MDKININISSQIICGDAREVLRFIPDSCVHLIITSPPYNVGANYDIYDDRLDYNKYLDMLKQVWKECFRAMIDGGRIAVNIGSTKIDGVLRHIGFDIVNQMQEIGYVLRDHIIWSKQNAKKRTAWGSWLSPSSPSLVYAFEYIYIFHKGNKIMPGDSSKIDITEKEFIEYTNATWNIKPQTENVLHPAPFPVELPKRLIKLYSYQDNLVLDPFAGSGTTGIAAVQTKRRFIGIDISEKYCKIAKNRLRSITHNMFD